MKKAASSRSKEMLENGTHPWMGHNGSEFAKKRNETLLSEGRHNFQGEQGSKHSTELNKKRIKNGTHNLVKRLDGTSLSSDRVADGTHHWLDNQGTVSVVDKLGNPIRIKKEVFWAQTGPKEDWEYVGITSKIAKNRLTTRKK